MAEVIDHGKLTTSQKRPNHKGNHQAGQKKSGANLFETGRAFTIHPAQAPLYTWGALSLKRRLFWFFADRPCPRDSAWSGKCSSQQGNQGHSRRACCTHAAGTRVSHPG